MQYFGYVNGQLCAEDVVMADIADQFGTPCYVYSRTAIEQQWQSFDNAFTGRSHQICYAVKANGNLAVLNLLARLGSGFDIVSVGELERVLKAGGRAEKVVFSGVGKRCDEMSRALEIGIKCFNIESISELLLLNEIAATMNLIAPVSVRVNPDVDARSHPYISTGLKENKFGIPHKAVITVYEQARALANIEIAGIACHIGSQITTVAPYKDAINCLMNLIEELRSHDIVLQHIDVGGGLGICYKDEVPLSTAEYARTVCDVIKDDTLEILMEPGRYIIGNTGVLLTRVEYLKENTERNFAVIDAAMNDLLRPALYDAWQPVLTLNEKTDAELKYYDLVGPVCESGDFIGLDRELALCEGDLLASCCAGAYGFCMSSNYNTRPRAAEIMVDGDKVYEIRQRETVEELMAGEKMLPA